MKPAISVSSSTTRICIVVCCDGQCAIGRISGAAAPCRRDHRHKIEQRDRQFMQFADAVRQVGGCADAARSPHRSRRTRRSATSRAPVPRAPALRFLRDAADGPISGVANSAAIVPAGASGIAASCAAGAIADEPPGDEGERHAGDQPAHSCTEDQTPRRVVRTGLPRFGHPFRGHHLQQHHRCEQGMIGTSHPVPASRDVDSCAASFTALSRVKGMSAEHAPLTCIRHGRKVNKRSCSGHAADNPDAAHSACPRIRSTCPSPCAPGIIMHRFLILSLLSACRPAGPRTIARRRMPRSMCSPVARDGALSLSEALALAVERAPVPPAAGAPAGIAKVLSERAGSVLSAHPAVQMRYQTDRVPGRPAGVRELEAGLELPLWRFGQRDALRREADAGQPAVGRGVADLSLACGRRAA
jgi:hypothetical protein